MNETLLTALIGAGSALLGVIVSQAFALLTSHYDRKHDRQTVLRQKYESLVDTVNNSLVLLFQGVSDPEVLQLNADEIAGNLRHAYTVSLIYFPLLTPYIQTLRTAFNELQSALKETPIDGIKAQHKANELKDARNAFDQAINQHAKDYT